MLGFPSNVGCQWNASCVTKSIFPGPMGSGKVKLSLKQVTKRKKDTDKSVQHAFAEEEKPKKQPRDERSEPLVIPAGENKLKFHVKREDAEAARALSEGVSNVEKTDNPNLVIKAGADTFQSETQQYKAEVEALPDAPTLDSEQYQNVPIRDFGAALLRGMGWTGQDKTKDEGDANDMPRPHRLGLGATPKLDIPTHDRMKRPDQMKRDEALKKQHEEYARDREKKMALDKQRTMQNGSLIKLHSGIRAEIIQLVGVPGLNMVRVRIEKEKENSVVKRGEIDRLLSREELADQAFVRAAKAELPARSKSESRIKVEDQGDSQRDSRKRRRRDEDDRNDRRREQKRSLDDKSHRGSDDDHRPRWAINNIRVRIITEKLGRKYFKEKGVVVDVTRKGVTIELPGGRVLDRVPERYLETALPKVGGNAVVLVGKDRYAKGELLERDSRKSRGVIQVFEEMNVLTLSLDDIAEWCGPLDDDLG